MKKIKFILIVIISLTFTFSCDNFEEINTDPNATTQVSSAMLATQTLKDTYRFWNVNAADFLSGNLFNHHLIQTNNENPGQYYWAYWPWGSFDRYLKLTDLKAMSQFAEGSSYEPSYKGLELFLKAWYGYKMTLDMGDVPYSEAGLGAAVNYRPVYDKQADVFAGILTDLQQAAAYFGEGQAFDGDIMYGGDASKWQKLCNAMQLKVIQTMSKKVTDAQKTRFAQIVNSGPLMTGNGDNFKLNYSTNPNAIFPFYQNGVQFRDYASPSKLTVDALKNLQDRRLFYFADPAEVQITAGKTESDFDAYVGGLSSLPNTVLQPNALAGEYSLVNYRYTQFMDNDPMLIFTYSEQCFIIAEAIEEGWVTGDAQQYYEDGVKAQLSYYMNLPNTADYVHGMAINQTYIDNYFTGEAAYKTGGSKQERLEQIWMQRWLIDFFQGNGGNYPQFLRTGYPVYPMDPATNLNNDNKNVYSKRWYFPTSEQSTNPDNYQKAINDQFGGNDATDQVPWYLQ
ncbi:MAG: SusD/RagB family nutrient-binding outer membrane lipoprotein [Flavobacteriaceae bacterium]|nr:SusD/RagB family nutrient-binding outer membrane lipoprotein [Flavobacteriaceae bacterium]